MTRRHRDAGTIAASPAAELQSAAASAAAPEGPARPTSAAGRPAETATAGRHGHALLICSSGGHLTQLLALRPWWGSRSRVWVTSDSTHARSALCGETIIRGHFPTTRNAANLIRNSVLAVRLLALPSRRPAVVVSTGAGLAFPFFVLGWMLRVPTAYIEVFGRVDSRTLTGRLCHPFASVFIVQREEQRALYRRSVIAGELLGNGSARHRGTVTPRAVPAEVAGADGPVLLVTVGTDHHPFSRLMEWIDRWLADGGDRRVRVLIQHGSTPVKPGPGRVEQLDYDRLQEAILSASIVVTHAGATAMEARSAGHRPIIVPRRPDLGEHVDDHQARFSRWLRGQGIADVCETEEELRHALENAVTAASSRAGAPSLTPHAAAGSSAGDVAGERIPAGNGRLPAGDKRIPAGGRTPARDGRTPARDGRIPAGAERAGQLIDVMLASRDGGRGHGRRQRSQPPGAGSGAHPAGSARPDPSAEPSRWPSVCVIVPTLGDRADLLERTLGGIRGQDYPGAVSCLVVFDRNSADATRLGADDPQSRQAAADDAKWRQTRAVADAAGARVLDNRRTPGLAGSRNTGILAADTELVAFCDDDDLWLPSKLRLQAAALAAQPSAVLISCGIEIEYGDTVKVRTYPQDTVTLGDLLRNRLMSLHSSTFVARRSALMDGVGLVNEEIPGSRSEDYELLLRVARQRPVLNVTQPGVRVMWHQPGQSMYGRWPLVAEALPWLLDRYPEFRSVPSGYARMAGKIAFASAASGHRAKAWRWAYRAFRANPRELRCYLAVAVTAGLLNPDVLLRALRRRGRGI